ncbi:hypothetical protein FQN55_003194 [Onygenales sp. PD_40]|nr:hypothetical protein FQN55_003194 [Onygenales sp. PD_40]KAK2802274.1 hypothetical protein FQN51_004563 [Onygenales sp. PD_10]
MTVVFHLQGHTSIEHEDVMMYIGVFAYGKSRFEFSFNPCLANIYSLCPTNASVPIEANGLLPLSQSEASVIPPIAMSVPDFEGQAIIRLFANSTQSEIGCYSSAITNGVTFAHPIAAGSIISLFILIAIFSSVALATYGTHIPSTRIHYAHAPSVFVTFSILHHIYFTGALSMNWPSVLVAFWSNYAWFSGIIYQEKMQNAISSVVGSSGSNSSSKKAALTEAAAEHLGGGFNLSRIYKRYEPVANMNSHNLLRRFKHNMSKRESSNSYSDSQWYGSAVKPGLPLPGNNLGFAGTLAVEEIPTSNAFLTAFIWFLILALSVASVVVLAKAAVECCFRVKSTKNERLAYFRAHWVAFLAAALLRTIFTGFFVIVSLALFQLALGGTSRVIAISSIVFLMLFIGMWATAAYAMIYHLKSGILISRSDRLLIIRTMVFGLLPWYRLTRESSMKEKEENLQVLTSLPWWKICYNKQESPYTDGSSIYEDEKFLQKFGWLSARFRRTRWWFFAAWLGYELIRACFIGAGGGHAIVQVYGLLAVECIAFIWIAWLRPFEATRLNVLMVYLLGISKISTTALSSLFHPQFDLERITATAIGVIIIVIQGLLTICLLITIGIGAISTRISLTRYRETPPSQPEGMSIKLRRVYLRHINRVASGQPRRSRREPPTTPETPKEPYFQVGSVRRCLKIEDEDADISGRSYFENPSDPTFPFYGRESPAIPRHCSSYYSINTFRRSPSPYPDRCDSQNSMLRANELRPCSTSPRSRVDSVHWGSNLLRPEQAADLGRSRWPEYRERTPTPYGRSQTPTSPV